VAQRLVTITSDFGVNDHYVGTMKGVIVNINPDVQIVDICNAVQSFDILDGALTIAQSYRYFPSDTIHLVVVDPGVGTTRRPILVMTEKHIFVAPDNGVLSLVYEGEERISVRHITSEHYFLQPTSSTFQGRDIFAAVAGYLSKGMEVAKFGEEITDYVRFSAPKPKPVDAQTIKGVVLKVDKFGNLVTNITPRELPQLFAAAPPAFKATVGRATVTSMRQSYAGGNQGEVFALLNSMGFLEIASNRGSAAQLAGAGKGVEVTVAFESAQAGAVTS
jgi:S-adenosylmethionine hydrolase